MKMITSLSRWLSVVVLGGFMATAQAHWHAPAPTHPQIALQMFTLRNVGSLAEQFAMAHDEGYQAVELVGTHDVDADEMNRLLALYKLRPISAHVQLDTLENDLQQVIAFNQAIGNHRIVMPYLAPEMRPHDALGWQQLGRKLDRIGAQLRHAGMTLAYHNHNFEMKKYRGQLGLDWLLQAAHPRNLKLELDVAWVFRGGQNPAQLIKRYRHRVMAIHVKDTTGIGERDDEANFAPIGDGLLAWNEILPATRYAHVPLYIIEHDQPADPRAIISEARGNLLRYMGRY